MKKLRMKQNSLSEHTVLQKDKPDVFGISHILALTSHLHVWPLSDEKFCFAEIFSSQSLLNLQIQFVQSVLRISSTQEVFPFTTGV